MTSDEVTAMTRPVRGASTVEGVGPYDVHSTMADRVLRFRCRRMQERARREGIVNDSILWTLLVVCVDVAPRRTVH